LSLSSLLVQRGIATIREIEEALARQVLYGGDFVTNLLEVSRIEELAMMPIVAEFYGLPAAPGGELPKPAGTALRIVAADVVQERTFVPLEADKTLVVAVAEPLSKEAEQELTFALALPIEQKVAPLFRIRQALARDYGVPIDKRIARLIQKVINKGPIIQSTFPPPLDSQPNLRTPPRPPSMVPPPVAAASVEPPPRTAITAQGTFARPEERLSERPARRRRGPLTLTVAIEELEASVERDVIFDVVFEFARQFFDYTALFIVHGEMAEGRDSFGDGAPTAKVARLSVPLNLDSLLSAARKAKKPLRMMPREDALDVVLMTDLGRDGRTECIVFPIIVRTRVVALILGDGGTTGIEDLGVRHVESLMETAAGAFERVIMRRKLKTPEEAAQKKKVEESVAPPPTKISEPEVPPDRISAEELAAPIREIMMEPPSKRNVVVPPSIKEPKRAATPPPAPQPEDLSATMKSQRSPLAGQTIASAPQAGSYPVPGGAGSYPVPGGGSGSYPVPGGGAGSYPVPSSMETGPPSSRGTGAPRRRATAPRLDFGTKAAEPSVVTESKRPGAASILQHHARTIAGMPAVDMSELRPDIHEAVTSPPPPSSTSAPSTLRDSTQIPASPPTGEKSLHPWIQEGAEVAGVPVIAVSEAPHSPKAESPPPMPVAAKVTDMSPQPIVIGPLSEAVPDYSEAELAQNVGRTTDPSQPPLDLPPPEKPSKPIAKKDDARTFVGASPLFDEEERGSDLNRLIVAGLEEQASFPTFDPDATPVAPPVSEVEETPAVPSVRTSEPVLSLSHRKGEKPPKMPKIEPKPMPISEEQISIGPHLPPSSHSDHSRVLPSVIVDVSTEYVELVDRVLAGEDEEAETQLLRAGIA
jgi:hypothetical protein